jgi:hypothetical protein
LTEVSVNTWDTARYSNGYYKISSQIFAEINPLNAKLNPTCHLLALLGAHHFLHVSRIRVKCTNEYFVRFNPYCGEEDAEILPIPNAGFSRANSWRLC